MPLLRSSVHSGSWMLQTFRSSGAGFILVSRCYKHFAPPELGPFWYHDATNVSLLPSGVHFGIPMLQTFRSSGARSILVSRCYKRFAPPERGSFWYHDATNISLVRGCIHGFTTFDSQGALRLVRAPEERNVCRIRSNEGHSSGRSGTVDAAPTELGPFWFMDATNIPLLRSSVHSGS
jgi:hypothetical protein